MQQIVRTLTMAEAGVAGVPQVLICDRDQKWSRDVQRGLRDAGIRMVLINRAPNANAYAERFVRSIKKECLDRLIPLGEQHVRRAAAEYVEHYHRERNHQGLGNRLIAGSRVIDGTRRIRRHRDSADFSTSTSGRRDRRVGQAMKHYAFRYYRFGVRTVHLDDCVEVDAACVAERIPP